MTEKLEHQVAPDSDNAPLVTPIYQSVKFGVTSMAHVEQIFSGERAGYFYSRIKNPTVFALEQELAQMQGRSDCAAFASGVGAISALLIALLKAGDHIIYFCESYRPTRYVVQRILKKFGIHATLLHITDHAGIEATLKKIPTRAMLFESPTNPMVYLADLDFLTAVAQRHGALTLMDNTFAGLHNHGQYPIDFFIHSLTKFAGGHGDVLGGAVIADAAKLEPLKSDFMNLGACLDAHAAFLIARGMKTYRMRYEKHCATAAAVAAELAQQPKIIHLRYPGFPSHPQHEIAKKQMRDFGSVIAFEMRDGPLAMRKFLDSVKRFKIGASLGSPESLVAPVELFYGGGLSAEESLQAGIKPESVRIAVGLDEPADLIEDLREALARV